jgi:hypothetical protein
VGHLHRPSGDDLGVAMTRIDVPTLQCNRCKTTTQDTTEMGRFRSLTGMYDKYQGASEQWDLCPTCWSAFLLFTGNHPVIGRVSTEAGIQHDGDPR